ncbi:hypothetical protein ONZ45_g18598 [Pleurotus djamor]|nr:hypothetical protein ONZ45_g18598 [Pleurotus djamor]
MTLFTNLVFLDITQLQGACIHTIPFNAWQKLAELRLQSCFRRHNCQNMDAPMARIRPLPALRRLTGPVCSVAEIVRYAPGVTHIRFEQQRSTDPECWCPPKWGSPPQPSFSNVVQVGLYGVKGFAYLGKELFPQMHGVKLVEWRIDSEDLEDAKLAISTFPAVQSILVLLPNLDVAPGRTLSPSEAHSWGPVVKQLELRAPGRRDVFTHNHRGGGQGWTWISETTSPLVLVPDEVDALDRMFLLKESVEDFNA